MIISFKRKDISMSLEIKVYCRSGRAFAELVIDESWWTDEEREFVKSHKIVVESYEQYTEDDCADYEAYLERQNYEYLWQYSIYVDGEHKRTDEANSYDYVTSYITEQVIR